MEYFGQRYFHVAVANVVVMFCQRHIDQLMWMSLEDSAHDTNNYTSYYLMHLPSKLGFETSTLNPRKKSEH